MNESSSFTREAVAPLPPLASQRDRRYLWCDGCLTPRPTKGGVCRGCGGSVCEMVGDTLIDVVPPEPTPQPLVLPAPMLGFPALMRYFRERAGLTQGAAARRAGLERSHIGRLENSGRNPTRETVDALAEAFSLGRLEHHHFLVVAGYAPASLMLTGWTGDFEQLLTWKRRHGA